MSKLLRLRSFRYRQTPNNLKRVKAHAERREPSTLLLVVPVNFADFERTRIKRTLHNMSVISLPLCYHTQFVLGFYIILVVCLTNPLLTDSLMVNSSLDIDHIVKNVRLESWAEGGAESNEIYITAE